MLNSDDPVVRSLVLQQGFVNAHASGDLRYWPKAGRVKTVHLPATATVLLGLGGPQGHIWRVAVGDRTGAISLLTLPELNLVESWAPHQAPVTALFAESSDTGEMRLISADSDGDVRIVGADLPREGRLLRRLGERITAIRAESDRLILMCGWQRRVFSRVGEQIATPVASKPQREVKTRLPVVLTRTTTPAQA